MTRRWSLKRTGAMLLAGALLFVLAGDRGVTAVPLGIDPLEVLDLQVKPNVLVALDTSGSMTSLANNNGTGYGGDHQRSKMWQAKQVLKAVFQANETKASFMFGTYRYSSAANPRGNMGAGNVGGTGTPSRFVYSTQSWEAGTYANPACTVDPASCPVPNPVNVTLPVEGPSPSMATTELVVNSLYAYQWIQNSGGVVNNTLVFNENGGPTCTVTVAPDFYRTGALLATAIQDAMNTDPCGGRANTYTVWYGVASTTVSVTTLTRGGGIATATTATPHGFTTGDSVVIAGAAPTAFNGTKTITVTGPNTFTYARTGTTPATGTITATKSLGGTADRFSFRSTGARNFTLEWGNATSTIRGVLNAGTANASVTGTNTWTQGSDARINLLRRTTGQGWGENYDPDGLSTTLVPVLDKPSPARDTTTYNLDAHKYWNGETVFVDSTGASCDIVPGAPTNPPSVTLELTTNCANGAASGDPANRATFSWGGGRVASGSGSCLGLDSKVPLIPCNQTTPLQFTGIAPFLENQVPLDTVGLIPGYSEQTNGTGVVVTQPNPGGAIASGGTPLAQTTNDVRALFGGNGTTSGLWHGGQATPALDPIKLHLDPKEKTIFILVTDGDACCGDGGCETDNAALIAAAAAQKLYSPDSVAAQGNGANAGTVNADGSINGDPAASVTTYVVAYGTGLVAARANWIAWGGSGMRLPFVVNGSSDSWNAIPTQAQRDACRTCIDAFQAPDADTLKLVLDKVINQGASTGEFSAQQSLTDSIFELAGDVPQGGAPAPWSPFNPRNRYDPLVPHRFVSTFSLPLFTGQIRAYTQDGPDALATTGASCLAGQACRRWSANDKLVTRVSGGMQLACVGGVAGATAGQCNFGMLSNGSNISNVGTAAGVGIRRRIFSTSRNGVFGPTVDQLIAGQSPSRVALWPPETAGVPVAPASNTTQGLFDSELGLPLDTASPRDPEFLALRTNYKACMGTGLPASCPSTATTSGFTLAHLQRARREAREMLLAFLAGARFVPDANGNPRRANATAGGYTTGDILYSARSEILAESTLATPAVVGPPQGELPDSAAYQTEYELYIDGTRSHSNPANEPDGTTEVTPAIVRSGFGLRNPDRDGTNSPIGTSQGRIFYANDGRTMKPVMSVLYAGSNLALHAFRAGTSVATNITTACPDTGPGAPFDATDCGGEELWAYLPYDQLGKLKSRYINNPQKRDPHDYVIARAVRFTDIFVPNPGTNADPDDTPVAKTVSGVSLGQIRGVWRKVLFVGRGKGGKYLTAIDVTAPGMFTDLALGNDIVGPVFLWSRGNPDTTSGQLGGAQSHDQFDYDAYLKMGETWSVPAVVYVGRSMMRADDASKIATVRFNPAGSRKPKGVDFVLYAGSGYGEAGEGTTFYSIDPLTGDVITSVDVDAVVSASYTELQRAGMPYANAIVANPVAFNASRFLYASGGVASPNVASAPARRVYVADLHGRLWKFLTAAPDKALPVADLGVDQPVATAASLMGLPANDPAAKPYVYVTSGNDNRATQNPRFANFGFRDDGSDTQFAVLTAVTQNGIQVYPPMQSQFVIPFEDLFRGTVQPATAFSDPSGFGRVFFGGTRFNPPNGAYAPPVPPFPCRSSFDSILYALGAESGLAAYDLAYGNAYQIFQDSRIVAVSTQAAPNASVLAKDEGLSKVGLPIQAPPPMGLAPSTQSTENVVPMSGPGLPQPTVRFGSTVCQ